MAAISMKALLESGVHFGHRTNRWDPRMKPYIFTERNGIHIIDLQQTVKAANHAYNIVRDCVQNGGTVLFVGTKRQAQETILEEATRASMPYVTERWLGGMLTNWSTMFARIQEMERLEKLRDGAENSRLTKKEGLLIDREITRLNTRLEGVRNMKKLPDLVFIIDVGREDSAVRECNQLKIPIVALVDTNCNPQDIDFPIPSNDDAIRAIKLLASKMADAVLEGVGMRKDDTDDEGPEFEGVKTGATSRKSGKVIDTDEVRDDAELFGASTLAKLKPAEVETAAVVVEVETPAVVEAPVAAKPVKAKAVVAAAPAEVEAPAVVAPVIAEVEAPVAVVDAPVAEVEIPAADAPAAAVEGEAPAAE